jgi:indole-3-glycerol phosphate synthase
MNRSPEATPTLDAIVAATRARVAERGAARSVAELEREAAAREPRGAAFVDALSGPGLHVIAECKRRSPSRGMIRREYDAAAIAAAYEAAGAAAISVLTEPEFFGGSLDDLERVRARVRAPLLLKDFVIDRHQLLEARARGADAALLIVAALGDGELDALLLEARALGLAPLVEVHDGAELERALAAGADLIGVNNRDLRTLQVDTGTARALISRVPPGVVAVAESGLSSHAEIAALREAGYAGFLVGEACLAAADPGAELRALLEGEGGLASCA